MQVIYRHWKDVPDSEWHWPDFSPQEMACRGTGKLWVDTQSMNALQALRTKIGRPFIINSAYRSPEHNRAVGGAKASQHLKAKAFDVSMANHNPTSFAKAARAAGFRGFGEYVSQNFMHIDTRDTPAKWHGSDGKYFPTASATPDFQPEPKPKTLAESLMKPETLSAVGGVLSGGAAIAQGAGPVQQALAIIMVVLVCFGIFILIRRDSGHLKED